MLCIVAFVDGTCIYVVHYKISEHTVSCIVDWTHIGSTTASFEDNIAHANTTTDILIISYSLLRTTAQKPELNEPFIVVRIVNKKLFLTILTTLLHGS